MNEITCILIVLSYLVAIAFGAYIHKKFRKKQPVEVTAETEVNGRKYTLGFMYESKNDVDLERFNLMSNRLCRAIKVTLESVPGGRQ